MHRTALITGASRGLGSTLAEFLARQNYDLIITARGADGLEAAANRLQDTAGRILAIAGDVAEPAHRRRLAEQAQSLGGLDLLVNNASDLGPSPLPALADYPLGALSKVFQINVFSPIALVQELLPSLQARRGMVVNISSDAAVGGYPGWGGYGASKAALDLVSLTLANELRPDGIAVVSVDPGDMRTDMHQAAFPEEDISDRPLPDVTLPFWGWLLGRDPIEISGKRLQAQSERWLSVEPV